MKKVISIGIIMILLTVFMQLPCYALDNETISGSYYWVEGVNDPAALKSAAETGVKLVVTPDGIGTLVLPSSTSIIKFDASSNNAIIVHLDGENVPTAFTYDSGILTVGELVFKDSNVFSLNEAFGMSQPAEDNVAAIENTNAPVGSWRTWTDSIGGNWVQVAHPIYNNGNTNLYLSSGSMDLEDSSGHLLDTMSLVSAYPQVIKPGETGWYYEVTMCDEAANVNGFVAHPDVKDAKVECIRLDVSDISIKDDTFGGITITGRVANNTGEEQSMVYVVGFVYDQDGYLIGQPQTILMNSLASGEKIGFSASEMSSIPGLTASSVASYEVYAFPYQFQFG